MIPKLRLIIASCLFAAWIGYLVFLVSLTRNPVILSRPQFLVADLYVLAELDGSSMHPRPTIRVREVAWPDNEQQLVGRDITVENLEECKKTNGWIGQGVYILPLSKTKVVAKGERDKMQLMGKYMLAEIPRSPGFHRSEKSLNYLLIYPATDQARQQLTTLIAEFHGE